MTERSTEASGRPPIDVERVARKLAQYIDQAYLDSALPVSKAAMLERTGVRKSTLHDYREHALVAPQLARLRLLQEARRGEAAVVATSIAADRDEAPQGAPSNARRRLAAPSEVEALDDVQLSERYAQARQQALWAASKLVARYRKVGHVSDLPAAAYHLDKALGELHGAMGLMRPLAEEWTRRSGMAAPSSATQTKLELL
jgi:hypothetical protein